jgi:hypothetical protein
VPESEGAGVVIGVIELAWMAAVIELKGRFRKYDTDSRATSMYKLMVEVSQIHVAERLAKLTGTKVSYSEPRDMNAAAGRKACREHCPTPHHHVTATMPRIGRWDMSGAGVIIVMHSLEPFLDESGNDEREEFIVEALTCVPLGKRQPGRAAIDRTILRLAGLGWAIPEELIPDGMPSVALVEARALAP